MKDHGRFLEGFVKSFAVILASEIGDKTFFIAAVMAMKNSRKQVFFGAMLALAAMTILSALMGWAAPNLISRTYTHHAATLLFFVFGVRVLYEAYTGEIEGGESELQEVERELSAAGHKTSSGNTAEMGGVLGGKGSRSLSASLMHVLKSVFSPVLLEAFTLTFLAEWGDRSQIATIGVAAASNVPGVMLGGILGHSICTGAAVLGGKHLASHIDERMVGVFGGVLFLVFGVHSLMVGPPVDA
jgi:putative Ca2+/H+ antiporter (TMEM165/GDT1 family)